MVKEKQRYDYSQMLKDHLQAICGQCLNWATQLNHKFEIDFKSANELIFREDSIEINTPIALYKRVSLDRDTEKLEKLLVKTLKSYLSKDELKLNKKDDLLAYGNREDIATVLHEIGANLDKDAYCSSDKWSYTTNWDNFLTNQIQWVQFEYNKKYYAIIQLSFLGCDIRHISNPVLVKLNEAESIYNITSSLDLVLIGGEGEKDDYVQIDYLDPDKWQVNKEKETLTNKETGFEYYISLSE